MTGEQQYGRGVRATKRNGPRRLGKPGEDSEFINRELTLEEIVEYRRWRDDIEDVSSVWGRLLEEGYRVNTKYDDYGVCYACYIIPGEGTDNVGFILTGRGGTPYRAVAEALFKHVSVFRGAWTANTTHPSRLDDPDF